ncbi:hypothetical protein [Burkholderia pseudomallei]|uniref:hypothetical protein n=1 Tax=Burkholderia pseudomallei TaxID=28450 RepID=UPI001AD77B2C|nr:hypothetical protein [Burkholderia pseudomallei]MBO7825942.1 hypothetical protein [Burkholderia pseudomallei]
MDEVSDAEPAANNAAGPVPASTNVGVFDISDADGVNASERVLMRLCRRSFLSLWSFANLHTDEDMRNGRGSAKEFADVLVVFGNDVVIFSDKHVPFQDNKPLDVAWKRWYKRAVEESVRQLHGAMNWVKRFPERVFLDSKCQRPLPVTIPNAENASFHLIAVTRGSFDACSRYFPGSLGTLQIRTDIRGADHGDNPFTIGVAAPGKAFVHVLDEFALEVVLREMDTASDFIVYLRDRERFLASDMHVVAAGEEQLVASYLRNGNELGRSFLPPSAMDKQLDMVVFDESHFEGLMRSPEYIAKKRLDQPSYEWDKLIEQFIRLGDPALVAPPGYNQENRETEEALRIIASESRFRRRILINAVRGLFHKAQQTNERAARLFTTEQDAALVYVFLSVPKRRDETYEEYRQHRMAVLHAYCRCAKLKCPDGKIFVGIAFDHPNKDYPGASEDLFVYECVDLDDETRAELEHYRAELGILADTSELKRMRADEYPSFATPGRDAQNADVDNARHRRERKRKNRAKAAKASRKINRKRGK